MMKLLFIGLGGAIGSISRYLLDLLISNYFKFEHFPIGIFTVNIIGCFFIGFFSHLFSINTSVSSELKSFITVGVLGGFTTYSAFKNDTFILLTKGHFVEASFYIISTLLVGLVAVYLGNLLSGIIFK